MAIKVGIFDDRGDIARPFSGKLKLNGFEPFLVINLDSWLKFTDFNKLDTALIHVDYWLRDESSKITAREVIARLPQDCCRILRSGHTIGQYKNEAIKLGGDYYVRDNGSRNEELIDLLRLGRVDSEQINLRGFVIKGEGAVYKAEMGLARDRNMNDDAYYIKKAKEGR